MEVGKGPCLSSWKFSLLQLQSNGQWLLTHTMLIVNRALLSELCYLIVIWALLWSFSKLRKTLEKAGKPWYHHNVFGKQEKKTFLNKTGQITSGNSYYEEGEVKILKTVSLFHDKMISRCSHIFCECMCIHSSFLLGSRPLGYLLMAIQV